MNLKKETHALTIMYARIDTLMLFGFCYLDDKNNTWS